MWYYNEQGSVLRTLLFLIYTIDLDNNITSKILKYVDDKNVFRKVNMMEINNIYKTR